MAVGSQQYTIATGPTLIAATQSSTATGSVASVFVQNTGATVYLGGATVSATTGMPVATATTVGPIQLFPGDQLYAFCATSTVLSVLQT